MGTIGTIICQECLKTIEHFKDEKVSTLYGKCAECSSKKN